MVLELRFKPVKPVTARLESGKLSDFLNRRKAIRMLVQCGRSPCMASAVVCAGVTCLQ
jgi:hypothetical protein